MQDTPPCPVDAPAASVLGIQDTKTFTKVSHTGCRPGNGRVKGGKGKRERGREGKRDREGGDIV